MTHILLHVSNVWKNAIECVMQCWYIRNILPCFRRFWSPCMHNCLVSGLLRNWLL